MPSPYGRAIDRAHLADVVAEHEVLDGLLRTLPRATWSAPTPAPGWTVADQVRHLAASERAAAMALAGDGAAVFTGSSGIVAPRTDDPGALLDAWRDARAETVARFAALDDRARVEWGAGPMSVRSLADARLMETWAHGLDCFAAAGAPPTDTPRLRRIADLARRALPYAFAVAEEAPPGDPRRLALSLVGPDGERWWLGPDDTDEVVSGAAGEWCRLAVRRVEQGQTSLRASGPLGAAALRVVRAYLA